MSDVRKWKCARCNYRNKLVDIACRNCGITRKKSNKIAIVKFLIGMMIFMIVIFLMENQGK